MNFEITKKRDRHGWVEGTADNYWFQAKVFDNPSQFGINDGKVSKLTICEDSKEYDYDKQVYHYSRGLDIDAVDADVLNEIVNFLEKTFGEEPDTRKKVTSKSLHIFDNHGETQDRYTIVFPNGDVYGCSENPTKPWGVGAFSHNTDAEAKEFTYEGKSDFVGEAQANPDWIGPEIGFKDLPNAVQEFIDTKFQTGKIANTYIYPLAYSDGEQFARISTDCPPCRIDYFREEVEDESIANERIDYVVASLLDSLNAAGYVAGIAEENEQADLIFKSLTQ